MFPFLHHRFSDFIRWIRAGVCVHVCVSEWVSDFVILVIFISEWIWIHYTAGQPASQHTVSSPHTDKSLEAFGCCCYTFEIPQPKGIRVCIKQCTDFKEWLVVFLGLLLILFNFHQKFLKNKNQKGEKFLEIIK